jgi:hypothetical protein
MRLANEGSFMVDDAIIPPIVLVQAITKPEHGLASGADGGCARSVEVGLN